MTEENPQQAGTAAEINTTSSEGDTGLTLNDTQDTGSEDVITDEIQEPKITEDKPDEIAGIKYDLQNDLQSADKPKPSGKPGNKPAKKPSRKPNKEDNKPGTGGSEDNNR